MQAISSIQFTSTFKLAKTQVQENLPGLTKNLPSQEIITILNGSTPVYLNEP
ncbi:hypothetical protein MTR_5g488345 [Medicago truncatula]|uniref:Uncharacterized protein n=1 Tax=Medicago truncatula TaxID=3880 RepID=A0A072UR86_MEDTR|nr:hypothetical protein MTR_5g488345 [Medicago truncatula]